MVILLEQSVVFNCPLLELHVYTAAVDADDASDPAGDGKTFRIPSLCNYETESELLHRLYTSAERQALVSVPLTVINVTEKLVLMYICFGHNFNLSHLVSYVDGKCLLLHIVGDACAQFHGGGESEASGRRGRHVGLQNRLQGVQHIVLGDLIEKHVTTEEIH